MTRYAVVYRRRRVGSTWHVADWSWRGWALTTDNIVRAANHGGYLHRCGYDVRLIAITL